MKNFQTTSQIAPEVSVQQQAVQNFGNNSVQANQVQTASTGSFLDKVMAEGGKLVIGMRDSAAVWDLQDFLQKRDYPISKVDGWFGDNTYKAVRKFQKDNGLFIDGWIGRNSATYISGLMANGGGNSGGQVQAPIQAAPPVQAPAQPQNPSTGSGNASVSAPEPWIRYGARGNNVKALQNALVRCGHSIGPSSDGVFGNMTLAGLKAFQAAHGLSQDGAYGPRTAEKLREVLSGSSGPTTGNSQGNQGNSGGNQSQPSTGTGSSNGLPEPWLRYGDKSDAVKALQTKLKGLGFSVGNPDGDFGAKTLLGVRLFQAAYGMSVDGEYGPATKSKMEKAINGEVDALPNAMFKPVDSVKADGNMSSALGWALTQVGAPYYGGASPYRDGHAPGNGQTYKHPKQNPYVSEVGVIGYDCSGFVRAVMRQAGKEVGFTSSTNLESSTQFVDVSKSALLPGDILVEAGSHVAIYLGGGQVIEATPPRVRVSSASSYISKSSYVARRLKP